MVRTANFSHDDDEIPRGMQAERNFWPLEGEELPDLSWLEIQRLNPERARRREESRHGRKVVAGEATPSRSPANRRN